MTNNKKSQITGREPRLTNAYAQPGMRRLSLRALATMLNVLPPHAISLQASAEALRSEGFYVRFNAARKLAQRGDREARLVMQTILDTGSAPSRASVARHLYGFSWFSAEPLIQQALKDPDSRVREGAIYALCELRELNAYQLMAQVLQHEVDNVRDAAAWGLRDCQDPAAVPVLEAVLLADDPEVRIRALEALGTNDTPQAMPVARNAMNDPEPEVKYAATLSLLELAGESWLQELSGIIGRTSGVTLQQILRGFFHATNYLKIDISKSKAVDLMVDALESALLDTLPDTRLAAIWPLAWTRHPRTPIILRQAYYREYDPRIKAQIMRVAVSLMSDAGEELLEDALRSKDTDVRSVAEQIVSDRGNGPILKYIEV